ncbi:ribbon-helix-helix protein, CopG family [Candidatus Kaiserbacteria bacterium]|nr:ribbon-helix-helix protein, CopG family [Candidatus Kaiserbacteria bacterium]
MATKFRSLSISLPEELVTKIDATAKKQYKTRSDIIREGVIMRILPAYTPTKAEERAIKKGKEAYARGEFITWSDVKHELDNRGGTTRR